MASRDDCRHYIERSVSDRERIERCRLDMADLDPFGCPEGCLFFEARRVSDAGFTIDPSDRPRAD